MKKRTVLITGGSRGIGKAISSKLKKEGYKVLAPSHQELDISNKDSINNYLGQNKKTQIDILINNAGINFPQWIDELTDENIEDTIKTNLTGPIYLTRGIVKKMKKQKWGRIINMSSMFGVVARGKQTLYSATKHGLNGFTKALALELGPYNILVNSVCPGFTNTDLVKRNPPAKNKALAKDVPLGRFAEPEEIAELVSFLISPKNSYMTGSIVVIDGGYTVK